MAERIFQKLASPGLRKQKEKETAGAAPSAATLHHPAKPREHGLGGEEEEVKEAPIGLGEEESTGVRAGGLGKGVGGLGKEEGTAAGRPTGALPEMPAAGAGKGTGGGLGKGIGGAGKEEGTGARAGGGGGAGLGEGLDVAESSGWTGAEKLTKDIPHKTTVGPKMETLGGGQPRTEKKAPAVVETAAPVAAVIVTTVVPEPAPEATTGMAPTALTTTTAAKPPAPATTTGKARELEEEEEEDEEGIQMPQTPFTTPAMAVAAADDTSQGATKAPFASDLYRAGGGPKGGKAAPPSGKEAAEELAHTAYRPGLSVLPPRGSGGPSPAEVSKMRPAEKGEGAEAKGPTPLGKEVREPIAPSAEAPTFGLTTPTPHAAPAATTAGGSLLGVSPLLGTSSELGGATRFEQPPMTFDTTPPAGGLGLGAASSPLLGTSSAGVGEALGKKPEATGMGEEEEEEEQVVGPEEAGAAVGPSVSTGVALPSPAQAAEAINKGLERGEHALETVARRFLRSIREHVPSLVSVADAGNVGVETVREAQGFVESVSSKTAAGIRARLPSPAQGLETANAGVEQAGLLAERAERIAQGTVEHATRAIRARLPSPAQGAEQANVTIEKAQDWLGHAEHIAEDLANRAVAAVHEILPNPAEGLATTNESLAVGGRMVKSAAGSLLEQLPHLPTATTTTTACGPAATGTTSAAASLLSPAALLDKVNAGIEAAAETVKGVLPTSLGGTTEAQQQPPQVPAAGLVIKAPVKTLKSMMPSTPFPTPVAGRSGEAEEVAPSALSPAAIAESINKGLQKGEAAAQGPVEAVKKTVSSTLGALPTLLPSPAAVAESVNLGLEKGGEAVAAATEKGKEAVGGAFAALPTLITSPAAVAEKVNRAIDTGADGPAQRGAAAEQGWEGAGGAGGGGKAGLGEAYDQRAREAEARRMLEEAERTMPQAEGQAVTGAVPSGTRQRQPRMPQASLFGAVENVLESMHEAFARGVKMGGGGGGGAREQPKPTLSAEEEAEEQALGIKAPVVIQEELTMETEGAAAEVQTVHVSKTIIK